MQGHGPPPAGDRLEHLRVSHAVISPKRPDRLVLVQVQQNHNNHSIPSKGRARRLSSKRAWDLFQLVAVDIEISSAAVILAFKVQKALWLLGFGSKTPQRLQGSCDCGH